MEKPFAEKLVATWLFASWNTMLNPGYGYFLAHQVSDSSWCDSPPFSFRVLPFPYSRCKRVLWKKNFDKLCLVIWDANPCYMLPIGAPHDICFVRTCWLDNYDVLEIQIGHVVIPISTRHLAGKKFFIVIEKLNNWLLGIWLVFQDEAFLLVIQNLNLRFLTLWKLVCMLCFSVLKSWQMKDFKCMPRCVFFNCDLILEEGWGLWVA